MAAATLYPPTNSLDLMSQPVLHIPLQQFPYKNAGTLQHFLIIENTVYSCPVNLVTWMSDFRILLMTTL